MTVGLTVSMTVCGQRSEGSGHKETDYTLLKCNLGLYTVFQKKVHP